MYTLIGLAACVIAVYMCVKALPGILPFDDPAPPLRRSIGLVLLAALLSLIGALLVKGGVGVRATPPAVVKADGEQEWWLRGGVVAVKGCTEDGDHCTGGGGCVIAFSPTTKRGIIVTVSHMFDGGRTRCSFGVGKNPSKFLPCEVQLVNEKMDLALVTFAYDTEVPVAPLASPDEVSWGDHVLLVGYPGKGWNLKVMKARVWMLEKGASLPRILVQTEETVSGLGDIEGFSGGALVARGRLFGIIQSASLLPSKHAIVGGISVKNRPLLWEEWR